MVLPHNAAKSARKAVLLPWHYMGSGFRGRRNRPLFDSVERYCFFLGYPRSGHTVVGALLDAHPEMVIAFELNATMYALAGFDRDRIFQMLLEKSQRFARQGCSWGGYSCLVPGQWQGRFRRLRVIGDKKGMGTTLWLRGRKERLDRLRRCVRTPIRCIHIVRNPFDNISTMLRRRQSRVRDLRGATDLYFHLCRLVAPIREELEPGEWIEMRHEDFLADPGRSLRDLCSFLGVDAPDDYVRDCTSIVFSSPRRRRSDWEWPAHLVRRIEEETERYPWLRGYRFEEENNGEEAAPPSSDSPHEKR